jgi:AcrR family transcriptional regulator
MASVSRRAGEKGAGTGAPATRRGTTYRPGRSTRDAIVRAAETVLIEHGHAQFSVQRVAAQVGISSGNLNYYFSTRAALLEALILHILARYRRRARVRARTRRAELPAEFDAVLDWLMEDSLDPNVARLFRQLWAIAASDARVAAAMDRFYLLSVRGHLRLLGVRPARTPEYRELEAIMCFMHVISEGTIVLFGTRRRARALFSRVRSVAERGVADLVARAALPGGTERESGPG